MDRTDFTSPSAGSLVPTIERQWSFVPAPLPPNVEIGRIFSSVTNAMNALGELRGACRRLQNPYILVRPLQRQEALTSSAMEGTYTTSDNLVLAEAGVEEAEDDSTREVVNYIRALNESLAALDHLPISHRLIKRAHEILLSGLSAGRGASKRPGEYKRDQNWIGGRTIENARFVPPPPAEAARCMDELEAYINRDGIDLSQRLIDLALVHYQLEAIHPFSDGNGRVGRMLISLMAVHGQLLDTPILYISPVMESHKDEYIDLMYAVSSKGQWENWINFFMVRVEEACKSTVLTVDRLMALQQTYKEEATKISRSAGILHLIDHLFERPAITVGDAKDKLNVTYAAARSTIDKLVELKILREHVGHYPKIFVAPGVTMVSRPAADDSPRPDRPAGGEDPK